MAVVLNFRRSPYLDDYPRQLHTRVESGPFRGLYTTAEKDRYFSRLSKDIDAVKGSARSILFLPHLPAGYLLTELRPATLTVWGTCSRDSTAACIEYYQKKASDSSMVVRIKELYYYSYRTDEFKTDEQDPMEYLLRTQHHLVLSREAYDIFVSDRTQ